MADKNSGAGNNPFFVVDKPFPELFASLTERVGPIQFATVTDTGSLVTFEIPVEVVGFDITSTLGPQAAFDGNAVVLRTTFDPTVGGEPVLEFELVGPSIDPGFDAGRFWVSSPQDMNVSPDTQLGRPQLSTGTLTALETDLVPGVTILTSEPDLVIELFFDGAGFVPLTNLGPDVSFAVIRMITEAVSSLPSPGPFDFGLGTVTTNTATSTVGIEPELEPDTTSMVIADGDPDTGFTLEVDTEPDPGFTLEPDLPTSTATSTVGTEPEFEPDDPDSCDDDPGPMCEDPPPRRSAIKLVMIGGVIVVTLVGASVGVWALGSSGGRDAVSDGGGQVLVDANAGPQDPPPSGIVPASSTSSTSSTTNPPSSSSTSSTSTSSTSSTSTSSTSSTSTSSTTISILPPPMSSDAPPASSTSSTTTTSSKPPVSSTSSTTSSTTSTTTTSATAPPTTAPLPTSKTSDPPESFPCPGASASITAWIDFNISNGATNPSFTIDEPLVCSGSTVTVSGDFLSRPPTGKWVYRVKFVIAGGPSAVAGSDTVTATVNWTNPP